MRGEEEKTEREDSRFEPAAIYDRTGNQLRLLNRKTAGSVFHVGGASSVWPSNYKSDDNPLAVSFSVSVSPHAPFYRDKRTLEREKLWRIVRAFKLVHHRVGYASRICLVVAIGQPRISSEMKQLIILTKPPAPWARCFLFFFFFFFFFFLLFLFPSLLVLISFLHWPMIRLFLLFFVNLNIGEREVSGFKSDLSGLSLYRVEFHT